MFYKVGTRRTRTRTTKQQVSNFASFAKLHGQKLKSTHLDWGYAAPPKVKLAELVFGFKDLNYED